MGPICFDNGYGPFRWVCLSGKDEDPQAEPTGLAMDCIDPEPAAPQDFDNYHWIRDAAEQNKSRGRKPRPASSMPTMPKVAFASRLKFNEMIRRKGNWARSCWGAITTTSRRHGLPLPRDSQHLRRQQRHRGHGTHCFAGNAARGMSLVALHNGAAAPASARRSTAASAWFLTAANGWTGIIRSAMNWDVMGGVARRNWARNPNAMAVAAAYNQENDNGDQITLPFIADDEAVAAAVDGVFSGKEK